MLNPILALLFGLALLVWSAHLFVSAAAALARLLAVPPLLVGMVVVGFGTSAPEILISAMASYNGNPGIALGNAFGSNISNIGLILGCSALLQPLDVPRQAVRRELPLLGGVTLLAILLLADGTITRLDAAVLLLAFTAVMAFSIHSAMAGKQPVMEAPQGAETAGAAAAKGRSPLKEGGLAMAGLLLMLVSSRLLVWGAVTVAEALGVSDLVIGLTIVAVGTSLPELASSIVAARKGEHDLALGNILGSNTFNTLAVLGVAGLIHPLPADPEVLRRDIPVMAFLTLLLYLFCRGKGEKPGRLSRVEGIFLLTAYALYTGYLVLTSL